ncbi:MAG: hypothetical protein PHO64_00935 [Thiomonas sp.]|nr:hypothetical protein [Thiomonas sp.]
MKIIFPDWTPRASWPKKWRLEPVQRETAMDMTDTSKATAAAPALNPTTNSSAASSA